MTVGLRSARSTSASGEVIPPARFSGIGRTGA